MTIPYLEARLTDITTLKVDAIVNAANEALRPGGGVCGAIHAAAGPELAKACARIGPCPTGAARITPGFRLRARYVIHAVGPVWRGGAAGEPELLANAYRSALRLAGGHQLHSVAFPAISTGVYGYPLAEATRLAVSTCREELEKASVVQRLIFACFSQEALHQYRIAGVDIPSSPDPLP